MVFHSPKHCLKDFLNLKTCTRSQKIKEASIFKNLLLSIRSSFIFGFKFEQVLVRTALVEDTNFCQDFLQKRLKVGWLGKQGQDKNAYCWLLGVLDKSFKSPMSKLFKGFEYQIHDFCLGKTLFTQLWLKFALLLQ
jgi:hypothetical protein